MLSSEGLAGRGGTVAPLAFPADTSVCHALGLPCGTQVSDKCKINWELLKVFFQKFMQLIL